MQIARLRADKSTTDEGAGCALIKSAILSNFPLNHIITAQSLNHMSETGASCCLVDFVYAGIQRLPSADRAEHIRMNLAYRTFSPSSFRVVTLTLPAHNNGASRRETINWFNAADNLFRCRNLLENIAITLSTTNAATTSNR